MALVVKVTHTTNGRSNGIRVMHKTIIEIL